MTNDAIKAKFIAAIEELTGRKVQTLMVHADPKVDGAYAGRATFTDDVEDMDFLVTRNQFDADFLDECDFGHWPPTSGDLNFFI